MSGDVQPRKRKDKKKKKDDLGIEEPRGTAATFGEGDVFMHSQHDHGTGGHWCAKIIFFSLLAVLVTLIGLIILENRGLSDLEANSVESRYSGVLEGWIEDSHDDDHHDEHTLELKHPDDSEHEENGVDDDVEIERIEREVGEDDTVSVERDIEQESAEDITESVAEKSDEDDIQDFLDAVDDDDEPPIEIITAPNGAAFDEIEEENIVEKPADTLAEEEEYEKEQEELRREDSETSHMWLKLVIGGALLVATHAVLRRFAAPSDPTEEETDGVSTVDRRMTLLTEESVDRSTVDNLQSSSQQEVEEEEVVLKQTKTDLAKPQKNETKEDLKTNIITKKEESPQKDFEEVTVDKELYSDEDEIEEDEEHAEEEVVSNPKNSVKNTTQEVDPDEDEDVEIIDDEQVEEEVDEEMEEEEISDVDDAELLSRLEAKYGRLPEPERPGKHKGGGNSVDDLWPGEPSDAHWRQELNRAEEELRQEWLD